jgi:GNAT superfamily N-acetyltransferase
MTAALTAPTTIVGIRPPDETEIVAEIENKCVGSAVIERRSRNLYYVRVFVEVEHRRRGIGRSLLQAAVEYVNSRNGQVRARVEPNELVAAAFCTSCGLTRRTL